MECPNCKTEMRIRTEISRGMGNQTFQECQNPECGLLALVSGDFRINEIWEPESNGKGELNNAIRTLR